MTDQTQPDQSPAPSPRGNNNFLFGFFLAIGFGIVACLAYQFPLQNNGGLLDNFASEELPNTDLNGLDQGPVFTTPPQIEDLDPGILLEDNQLNVVPRPPMRGDEEVVIELLVEITEEGAIVTTPDGTVLEESEYPPGLAEQIQILQALEKNLIPDGAPAGQGEECEGGACTLNKGTE